MSKYVTGPWVSETSVSEDGIAVIAVDPGIPAGCTPTRGMVAYVHSGVGACQTDDEAIATARLIAAAPDLFSALADMVDTFQARPDMLQLCGFKEHAQIKAACDALNRATGETK